MSESVSRKNFLNLLDKVDYYKFGNISADWDGINLECEKFVNQNSEYWCSLVPDETFQIWDENGKEYLKSLENVKKWGYNSTNTMSWETTSRAPVLKMNWEQSLYDYFPLSKTVSRPTLQKPGNVMPWHVDNFYYFSHEYPELRDYIVRFIVFHNDWDIGHILQAGNTIISHWKRGDIIVWHPQRVHLSCNVGISDKWTTNFTGILKETITIND
jgi:hypothetical protein